MGLGTAGFEKLLGLEKVTADDVKAEKIRRNNELPPKRPRLTGADATIEQIALTKEVRNAINKINDATGSIKWTSIDTIQTDIGIMKGQFDQWLNTMLHDSPDERAKAEEKRQQMLKIQKIPGVPTTTF